MGVVETPSFLPDTIAGRDLAQTRRYLQIGARGDPQAAQARASGARTARTRPTRTCSVRSFSTASSTTGIAGRTPGTTRSAIESASPRQGARRLHHHDADGSAVPHRRRHAVKPNGLEYPRLIPVEYTPLYTGIRQRFGSLGGTYVWPWAYDRWSSPRELKHAHSGRARSPWSGCSRSPTSSPAAALRRNSTLMLGDRVPARLRPALGRPPRRFPRSANWRCAVRDGEQSPAPRRGPHGDGGFTDNFGLMPLLARQVRNIIVFVNSSTSTRERLAAVVLHARSRPGRQRRQDDERGVRAQEATARCSEDSMRGQGPRRRALLRTNWTVQKNELYNIRGYTGLNICWVYNYMAEDWRTTVPTDIKAWLKPTDPKKLSKQAKDAAALSRTTRRSVRTARRDQAEAAAGEPARRSGRVVDQQHAGGRCDREDVRRRRAARSEDDAVKEARPERTGPTIRDLAPRYGPVGPVLLDRPKINSPSSDDRGSP